MSDLVEVTSTKSDTADTEKIVMLYKVKFIPSLSVIVLLMVLTSCADKQTGQELRSENVSLVRAEIASGVSNLYQEIEESLQFVSDSEEFHDQFENYYVSLGYSDVLDSEIASNSVSESSCPECEFIMHSANNVDEIVSGLEAIASDLYTDVIINGDDAKKMNKAIDIDYVIQFAKLYRNNPAPINNLAAALTKGGIDLNTKSGGQCFMAVLGGSLLGGLAGCKVGAEIGSYLLTPQSVASGCGIGAVAGAITGGISSYFGSGACD